MIALAIVVVLLFVVGISLLVRAIRDTGAASDGQGAQALPVATTPAAKQTAAPGPTGAAASGSCPTDSVQVSAKPDKSTYEPGKSVQMQLTVRNTNSKTCSIEVGPAAQNYMIKQGDTTLWSSKACMEGSSESDVQNFAPNNKKTATVTWDQIPADSSCKRTADSLKAGTYQLVIQLGDVTSSPANFTVADKDASAPKASATAKSTGN